MIYCFSIYYMVELYTTSPMAFKIHYNHIEWLNISVSNVYSPTIESRKTSWTNTGEPNACLWAIFTRISFAHIITSYPYCSCTWHWWFVYKWTPDLEAEKYPLGTYYLYNSWICTCHMYTQYYWYVHFPCSFHILPCASGVECQTHMEMSTTGCVICTTSRLMCIIAGDQRTC